MNLPDDCDFAYVVSHEAWYSQVVDHPSVSITAASRGGGVAWEFMVDEVDLGNKQPAIAVRVFDDAFNAFQQIPEFFAALAADAPKTLREVTDMLDGLGAVDQTERTEPGWAQRHSRPCPSCGQTGSPDVSEED